MEKGKILVSGITATSAMTLFSFIMSELRHKNFKEPEVLSEVFCQLLPELRPHKARLTAWFTHYIVGLLFVSAYSEIWEKTRIQPKLKSGLTFGSISGLLAIIGWKIAFHLCKRSVVNHKKNYYGHLQLAHILFGVIAAYTHKKPKQITA